MGTWATNLTKTPYLVLFVLLISVGVGTASALVTITLAGNTIVQGTLTADNYFDNGNTQTGTASSALGGNANTASADGSTVGGGDSNTANGNQATVGGGGGFGLGNTASGDVSTVGGGAGNTASVAASTVGGGNNNIASGVDSTVGGGFTNTASKFASTVGGGNNNIADGFAATVPGGELNEASGDYSFAAGRRAHATLNGAFVWADSTNADFTSTAPDQFSIRAAGGVRIVGDVSANNFEYSSPQTRSVVIFPVEFASTFDVDWLVPIKGAAGVIKSSSTKNFLFASIPQLPDGATITRLDCRVFDNSIAFEVGCDLLRKSFASDVGEFMAQTATSGASASNQDISDTSINTPVVDRDTFGYVVRYVVGDNVCDESCKLFSAKVTYTIDRVE